ASLVVHRLDSRRNPLNLANVVVLLSAARSRDTSTGVTGLDCPSTLISYLAGSGVPCYRAAASVPKLAHRLLEGVSNQRGSMKIESFTKLLCLWLPIGAPRPAGAAVRLPILASWPRVAGPGSGSS